MSTLRVTVLLLAVCISIAASQDQPRLEQSDPNGRCFHSEDGTPYPGDSHMHPCACKMVCLTQADGTVFTGEDPACVYHCKTSSNCACHGDEMCQAPEVH